MFRLTKPSLSSLFHGLSGSLGGLVFRILSDGATRFSSHKFRQGPKDFQQRLKQAALYASYAARAEPMYAARARGTLKTAYYIALSDWLDPPVIHQVQCCGNMVLVKASDDVLVTRVEVTLLDEGANVLEQGEATRLSNAGWWEYRARHAGTTVIARAWDLAGNVCRFVVA